MDKAKGIMKNGWQPKGDPKISRDTWKSDLKGMVPGSKKKDPYEDARNHQSAPLTSLKDPDSFGPPPKHTAYYGHDGQALNPVSPAQSRIGQSSASYTSLPPRHTGGLGAPAVQTGYAHNKQREMEQREAQEQAELNRQKAEPYRRDTSGLRTDHLPPPPRRSGTGSSSLVSPAAGGRSSPALPPRVPPRQATGIVQAPASRQNTASTIASHSDGPPPFLPPRQNEYPDENTPPAPPSYGEALNAPQPPPNQLGTALQGAAHKFGASAASSWQQRQQNSDPGAVNQGAASRLGQAGVNIPGFGIGSNGNTSTSTPSAQQVQTAASFAQGAASRFGQINQSQTTGAAGHGGQLSELQQRFSRMNTGVAPASTAPGLAAAAQKKQPPPPPPKKSGIAAGQNGDASASAPPPVPMSSKPRPG